MGQTVQLLCTFVALHFCTFISLLCNAELVCQMKYYSIVH